MKKIGVIGCGFVGMSFVFSAISSYTVANFFLYDINSSIVKGNILDLEDSILSTGHNYKVTMGNDDDLDNLDILIITAGAAQKPNQSRLDLIKINAKIISDIGKKISKSKFSGITIITSNPCDILATIYLKITKFNPCKVISSGTTLDSKRFKFEIQKITGISINYLTSSFLIGEHGDSSVPVVADPFLKNLLSEDDIEKAYKTTRNKAYNIINNKKQTYYGIGATLANLVRIILSDENALLTLGTFIHEYDGEIYDIIISLPVILTSQGIKKRINYNYSDKTKKLFKKSCLIIKNILDKLNY